MPRKLKSPLLKSKPAKDGSLIRDLEQGMTGAALCEQYGLKRTGPGAFEKTDFSDEPKFKGVKSLTHLVVTFDEIGNWTLHQKDASGEEFTDQGDGLDGLEYYLDPGSLQDEGFEPED